MHQQQETLFVSVRWFQSVSFFLRFCQLVRHSSILPTHEKPRANFQMSFHILCRERKQNIILNWFDCVMDSIAEWKRKTRNSGIKHKLLFMQKCLIVIVAWNWHREQSNRRLSELNWLNIYFTSISTKDKEIFGVFFVIRRLSFCNFVVGRWSLVLCKPSSLIFMCFGYCIEDDDNDDAEDQIKWMVSFHRCDDGTTI